MGRKELFTRIGNKGEGRRAGLVLDMLSSGSWVWRCLFGITSVCIIVEAINTKLSMKLVHLKGEEKKNSKRNPGKHQHLQNVQRGIYINQRRGDFELGSHW